MGQNNRYILSKKIARGGMAEIFLGKQVGEDGFQRICCIKRILPQFADDKEFIEMFRDEAHICKRLQHANIARVESFEEVEESYAIIMEFINGADLRSALASCEKTGAKFSVPMLVYIIAEAARGLHYAHEKVDELSGKHLGIVHRDVSPQNILLSFEGEVKITDFGIAEADDKDGETKTGVVKGKYAYMSPEQVRGKQVDGRTDIFALCVILWEALSMQRLFNGENESETIQMVRDCRISRDISTLNPNVDEELKQLVLKGLSASPKDRYGSAALFEKHLRGYLSKSYADFAPQELGQFLKGLLEKKRFETLQSIRELLSAEQPKASKKEPEKPQNFSVKKAMERVQADQLGTRPQTTHSIKAPPKKKKPQGPLLVGLLFIGLLSFAGWFYLSLQANPKGATKLTISTIPAIAKITLDKHKLFKGQHVQTPATVTGLKPGTHELILEKSGFETKRISFTNQPGEEISKLGIVLTQKEKSAPTKIYLKGNSKNNTRIIIDNGVFSANLFKDIPESVKHLTKGNHSMVVKPHFPKNLNQFQCKFNAHATHWGKPLLILIDTQQKSCEYYK